MGRRKVSKSSPVLAATIQVAIRALGVLPLSAARGFGRLVGEILWHVPNQFRAASLRNVERCLPELEEPQRRRLVRASLVSTGLNVAEAGAIFHWDRKRLMQLEDGFVGEDLVANGLARSRGVIMLGPHVGNWEYLSHSLGVRWGMTALYRPPRIVELDEYIRRSREHLGSTELVPADQAGLRRVARALRAGELVGILPDQEPLKDHGVFAPFFGVPALTMTLVGRLVRRFDPTVLIGFAERTAAGRFRIRVSAAPEGLGDVDPVRAASQLNRGVEECVRACPEQYTWSYRRFKTRPPEELSARASTRSAAGSPGSAL